MQCENKRHWLGNRCIRKQEENPLTFPMKWRNWMISKKFDAIPSTNSRHTGVNIREDLMLNLEKLFFWAISEKTWVYGERICL